MNKDGVNIYIKRLKPIWSSEIDSVLHITGKTYKLQKPYHNLNGREGEAKDGGRHLSIIPHIYLLKFLSIWFYCVVKDFNTEGKKKERYIIYLFKMC